MFHRYAIAKFLLMFIPAFTLSTGIILYFVSASQISKASDQLGARIGANVAKISGLINPGLINSNPQLTSKLLSILTSDQAITCVDVQLAGNFNKRLSQPRNLGCRVMKPQKTVELDVPNIDSMTIVVGFNENEIAELRQNAWLTTVFTTAAAVAAALGFGIFAFRSSVSKPVHQLIRAISSSEDGRFTRALEESDDEIGRLCSSFNMMQDKLENERHRTRSTLKNLETIYNTTPALLFTMDIDGTIKSTSEFWLEESGYSAEEVKGRSLENLLNSESRAKLRSQVLDVLPVAGFLRDIDLSFVLKSGDEVEVLLSIVPDRRRTNGQFVCIMNDITKLRAAEKRLHTLSVTDELTGLPNRRAMTEYFETMALGQDARLSDWALLFVDLDDFKVINDTFGHEAGDRVLSIVAKRISDIVGSNGFVARFGGDEFAIALKNIKDHEHTREICNTIITSICQEIEFDNGAGQIGASIGIAYGHDAAIDPAETLRLADQAMYVAKNKGKNRALFYEDIKIQTVQTTDNNVGKDKFDDTILDLCG